MLLTCEQLSRQRRFVTSLHLATHATTNDAVGSRAVMLYRSYLRLYEHTC